MKYRQRPHLQHPPMKNWSRYFPDLVFLDIKLKGEEDGIHIAEHIKEKYNIPVIFLTSYVDQDTLDRAKVTEPYGYIVKPFNDSDLKTTVEMALFKYSRDREVQVSAAWRMRWQW